MNIEFQRTKSVSLASIFNTVIIRPRRIWLALFCSTSNLNLITDIREYSYRLRLNIPIFYQRIVSTLPRHHQLIRQRIVPQVLAFFSFSKSIGIKTLISWTIFTLAGSDLIDHHPRIVADSCFLLENYTASSPRELGENKFQSIDSYRN